MQMPVFTYIVGTRFHFLKRMGTWEHFSLKEKREGKSNILAIVGNFPNNPTHTMKTWKNVIFKTKEIINAIT